ncbi:MAG: glycosyltransferase family 4 protein [Victivallales bacterium]|nr:glycosyltransferase family 4 protein [Victivallales bacterium]
MKGQKRAMHIGIDGTPAINEVRAIRRYAWNLLAELAKLDSEHTFSLLYLGRKPGASMPPVDNPRFSSICTGIPGRLLKLSWRLTSFPGADFLLKRSCDLFHFPGGSTYIPVKSGKIITTMHGFLCQFAPEKMENARVSHAQRILERTVRKTDHFITVSEANKRELNELWGVPLERITAIPLGVGEEFREYKDIAEHEFQTRRQYGLGEKDFLLFVGALEPHKNIHGIIRAYSLLEPALKKKYNLALVGAHTKYTPEYEEMARKLGVADNLAFVDYIQPGSSDLAYIYNLTHLLVFPTFYEGWASPPLEAMKCGTPALVSDIPSLRESTGGIASYCNPESTENIATKITEILQNKVLYDKLKQDGLTTSAQYTWEKCARETLKMYDSLQA